MTDNAVFIRGEPTLHPGKHYAASVNPHTVATFRALVEAIVPNTPTLASFGAEQAAGAVELHVHEYMIWELDHSLALFLGTHLTIVPLSASTAGLLNAGAVQLIASGQAQHAPNHALWGSSPFAALSPADRIRVLAMLEHISEHFRLHTGTTEDSSNLSSII